MFETLIGGVQMIPAISAIVAMFWIVLLLGIFAGAIFNRVVLLLMTALSIIATVYTFTAMEGWEAGAYWLLGGITATFIASSWLMRAVKVAANAGRPSWFDKMRSLLTD